MRRIVTGVDATGKQAVLTEDDVSPIVVAVQAGVGVHRVWELDSPPTLPVSAVPRSFDGTMFPSSGGLRFGFISIEPGISYELPAGLTAEQLSAAGEEAEQKLRGMSAAFDRERPGMHTTYSVDFIVIVQGEGAMELDDGTTVALRPGDCVVQNGTAHKWLNDGDVPLVLGYSLVGAT